MHNSEKNEQRLRKLYERCGRDMAELYAPGETLLVFGDGNAASPCVMVGEAPGKDEVLLRRPFVGKAGRNLDTFLLSTGIRREDVYITNAVKLRPMRLSDAGNMVNRPPTTEEIMLFRPYLQKELEIIAPRLVVTLGNVALRAVTGERLAISEVHGAPLARGNYIIFPLYHPASVIYNQALKSVYMDDLNKLGVIVLNNWTWNER